MAITYEVQENGYILKTDGDKIWSIPNDLGNSDYQAYLADEAKTK